MQTQLLRSFLCWISVASVALAAREIVVGGPVLTALLATASSAVATFVAYKHRARQRAVGVVFSFGMVLLISRAALDLGGAAGSALCFSFIPGFLATLVLGQRWGWAVCATMLASLAALLFTTELPSRYDELRFMDEVVVTLFATGLAHSLVRSFAAYESVIAERRAALDRLREQRQAVTLAIYEQLEPLSTRLVDSVPGREATELERRGFAGVLRELTGYLSRAKELARSEAAEFVGPDAPDRQIRRGTMRVWLRMAAALMAFFVIRNWLAGVVFVPSLFTLVLCVAVDLWLRRPESDRYLEATALTVGVLATGPLVAHVQAYGATPDAPALVVMPGTVLFTALLSRGPAAWAVVVVNVAVLVWVGAGEAPTLAQSRRVSDLALSFLVVAVAMLRVFELRHRYVEALIDQGRLMVDALRQHRRLAGTLFHDVSNHLQVLALHVDLDDPELPSARSLSRRIQRLITLSKDFLLDPSPEPVLSTVALGEALELLNEAFGPKMSAKRLRLSAGNGMNLEVRAQPELLVESVLGNLVSNAVKFSPQGSDIELRAERVGSEVRVSLSDSGAGIPPEVRQGLGREGAVPSRPGTDGEAGQGYGLQLVQEHLKRMGGRLELNERTGGGTEAVVWLAAV